MITRGSKYFYGAAAFAFVTALIYGFVTGASAHGGVSDVFANGALVDSLIGPISFGWKGWVGDQVGYSILMGFAGVMAVMGGLTTVFRDGSPEALAELQGATVERSVIQGNTAVDLRVASPQGLSYWPLLTAFSGGALIVGAAVSSTLFVIGCIGMVVAGVEWTVRTWSEQATGDPVENRAIRDKFMYPIEIPVGATLGVGLIVLSMSQILLAVPKVGAVFVVIGLAIAVFVGAIVLANRPELKRSVLVGALLLGGVVIIGGGIAAGIAGQRESEHHDKEESLTVDRPAGPIDTTGPIGRDGDTVAGY